MHRELKSETQTVAFPTWEQMIRDLLANSGTESGNHQKLLGFLRPKSSPLKKLVLSAFCHLNYLMPKSSDMRRLCYNDWKSLYYFVLDLVYQNRNIEIAENSQDLLFRDNYQLPCTLGTRVRRVQLVSRYIKKNEPILIIGDDDWQCFELAGAGFKDITVVEIDPKIVEKFRKIAFEKNYDIKFLCEDIQKVSPKLARNYRAVLIDPPCHYEGFKLFFDGALNLSLSQTEMSIFLNTQPFLYKQTGYEKIISDLSSKQFELCFLQRGFNQYAIPRGPKSLINSLFSLMKPSIRDEASRVSRTSLSWYLNWLGSNALDSLLLSFWRRSFSNSKQRHQT